MKCYFMGLAAAFFCFVQHAIAKDIPFNSVYLGSREGDPAGLMQSNKKVRFDIMDSHGDKPHFHLERKTTHGKWIDASPEHRYYFTEE